MRNIQKKTIFVEALVRLRTEIEKARQNNPTMRYEVNHQNEDAFFQQHLVRIFKMAIGSESGLMIASAIVVSFYFSLLTAAVLVVFALLAAWMAKKLRD